VQPVGSSSREVVLNGFVCDGAEPPPLCALGGVGEPRVREPGVIYTKCTPAGFDASCNALARKPRADALCSWSGGRVGQHEQQLIDHGAAGADRQRRRRRRGQRRASAPDRLSGTAGGGGSPNADAAQLAVERRQHGRRQGADRGGGGGGGGGGGATVRVVRPYRRGQKTGDETLLRVAKLY
jgi:hypothetical protein